MAAELVLMGMAMLAVAGDGTLESLERKYRQQKVQDRPCYAESTIYDLFYHDSGVPRVAIGDAWRQAARILQVHPGQLRPGDRITGTLGFPTRLRGSRSDVDRLIRHTHAQSASRREPILIRLRTLNDVIGVLARVPGRSLVALGRES